MEAQNEVAQEQSGEGSQEAQAEVCDMNAAQERSGPTAVKLGGCGMSREAAALTIMARRKRFLSVFMGFKALVLSVQVLVRRKRSGPAPSRPHVESEQDVERSP